MKINYLKLSKKPKARLNFTITSSNDFVKNSFKTWFTAFWSWYHCVYRQFSRTVPFTCLYGKKNPIIIVVCKLWTLASNLLILFWPNALLTCIFGQHYMHKKLFFIFHNLPIGFTNLQKRFYILINKRLHQFS